MERSAWTDERLDDRFDHVEQRFDQVDRQLGELRMELRDLRITLIRVGGGMMAGLVGVIAAVLVRGG
ncbi:MAG: hypothetical protein ACXWZ6_09665 [Solirubrobacterales bacterium]